MVNVETEKSEKNMKMTNLEEKKQERGHDDQSRRPSYDNCSQSTVINPKNMSSIHTNSAIIY